MSDSKSSNPVKFSNTRTRQAIGRMCGSWRSVERNWKLTAAQISSCKLSHKTKANFLNPLTRASPPGSQAARQADASSARLSHMWATLCELLAKCLVSLACRIGEALLVALLRANKVASAHNRPISATVGWPVEEPRKTNARISQ